jgi:hypothetical protein
MVHEQRVVSRPDVGLKFADGNAEARVEIDLLGFLNLPARLFQHRVDVVAGHLFGALVDLRHAWSMQQRSAASNSCVGVSASDRAVISRAFGGAYGQDYVGGRGSADRQKPE